jgi:hypothetical protein
MAMSFDAEKSIPSPADMARWIAVSGENDFIDANSLPCFRNLLGISRSGKIH